MFDPFFRRAKDRLLAPLAESLRGVAPGVITAMGLGLGLGAAVAAWAGAFGVGLGLWLANRFMDGLDGAVARRRRDASDLGAFLDLVADFVVYAAVPVAMALRPGADPELAQAALLLVAVFYVNAASWMVPAAILEKRGRGAAARGEATSVTIPEGLVAGGETVVFYALFFLLPHHQVALFHLMAGLTALTVVQRIVWGIRTLGSDPGVRSRAPGGAAKILVLALAGATGGCTPGTAPAEPTAAELALLPWDSVVARARDSEVIWRMWRGDPAINAYVDGWVAPRLLERYGIRLRAVEGRGAELVNQLVVEREARAAGGAELVWINGETFHNLRKENLLQGPWAHVLPSAAWVDSASAIILKDFEQELEGFESPWGRVQFALIYDSLRTPHPPRSVEEMGRWILDHPGRFTHDQAFTGVTFLKVLMYALDGGVDGFQGGFQEEDYARGRDMVMGWLELHTPAFWREGTAYPAGVAELHRLFANGEVDFSMSYNENEAVTKARQGVLPPTSRPLLLREGTMANAHHLGIPFNAPNPAGAMVVADFLLSPEAQLEKLRPDVWGDGTVLDIRSLPNEWRERFGALEADPRALPRDSLTRYALPEVAPEYHERLTEDWRRRVRRAGG